MNGRFGGDGGDGEYAPKGPADPSTGDPSAVRGGRVSAIAGWAIRQAQGLLGNRYTPRNAVQPSIQVQAPVLSVTPTRVPMQAPTSANGPIGGQQLVPMRPQQLAAWPSATRRIEPRIEWFGPGQPPVPLAPKQDVAGRAFDYQAGYNMGNTPRADTGISFGQLRGLADALDVARLCIETRKDQMSALSFSILPKQEAGEILRGKSDSRCQHVEDFLRRPDRKLSWNDWMRELLEEMFVLDATSIYVRRTIGGDPYALEIIDGSLIKPLLDVTGRRPEAPAPAFQQVLKGMPAIDYSEDELIYAVRNRRVHKAYGCSHIEQITMTINIAIRREIAKLNYFCYSDDMEVLTRRGWLRFKDTDENDWFATRQKDTGIFEWQQATSRFYKHFAGDMVRIKNRSLDLLVTPHHRVLVNTLPAKLGRFGGRGRGETKREHVVAAEGLVGINSANIGIPQTSVWAGEELGEQVFVSQHGNTQPVRMSGDDYCAFMGMYIAEGSLRRTSVQIAQPRDRRGSHALYAELLSRVLGDVPYHSGTSFEFSRVALLEHLAQFGHAHEKFVPESILNATPRQLAIFWDYYFAGDGSAPSGKRTSEQAITVSKRLADHLTEVLQKMGFAPTLYTKTARTSDVQGRKVNAREAYIITKGKRKATKGWTAEYEHYEGNVACVSVPNTFLYVRRNGKACWSGNTEGNIPEALISTPKEWTPDMVTKFQIGWDAVMKAQQNKAGLKFVPGEMNFQPTRSDGMLMGPFDEWVARVICYAFSLPPTAFVTQQNRATAETAHETALEEGLAPLMVWFKGVMDEIIQVVFGYTDLEFVFDDIKQIDPEVERDREDREVAQGLFSLDEVRAKRGQDPIGVDVPFIMGLGPMGIMFLDDLMEAKAAGLLKFQAPPPPVQLDEYGNPIPQAAPMGMAGAPPALAGPGAQAALPAPAPDPSQQPGATPGVSPVPVASQPAPPVNPGLDPLTLIPGNLLAAVGLAPGGRMTVPVTRKEEIKRDPMMAHVGHPQVLSTLRQAEALQRSRRSK